MYNSALAGEKGWISALSMWLSFHALTWLYAYILGEKERPEYQKGRRMSEITLGRGGLKSTAKEAPTVRFQYLFSELIVFTPPSKYLEGP